MENKTDLKPSVDKCHTQLASFPHIRKYLNDRLITGDLIEEHKLGYGQFYGKRWITIPVFDIDGVPIAMKLRKDPTDKSDEAKYKNVPMGVSANLYPWKTMVAFPELLVCCEGEFDSILLNARGIPAITSTAGAGTFKDDWLVIFRDVKKIYICFDRDEAGFKGGDKLGKKILKKYFGKNVYQIILPEVVGDHGDITDYFQKTDGNIDKLFGEYAREIEPDYTIEEIKKSSNGWSGGEITQADIEEAKKANCEDFVKIEKTGGNVKFAKCPFKAEKTPSFACYPDGNGYFCFSDDTDILTEDGFMPIKDIVNNKYGRNVFSLNLDNLTVEKRRITNFFKFNYIGEMINIKSKNFDFLVTPEHKTLICSDWDAKKNPELKRFSYKEAKNVVTGDRITKVFNYCLGKEVDSFTIPGITRKINQFEHYKKKDPISVSMDDWLKFFGIWLANGHTSKNGYFVGITIGVDKKDLRDEIMSIINRIGFKCSYFDNIRDCGSSTIISVCNIQLGSYLSSFGKAADKYIPKELKSLSTRQLKILFDWMYLGDGCKNDKVWCYSTISKKLADDFQEISIKIGLNCNVASKKYSINGINRTLYRANLSEDILYHNICSIEKKDYNGIVYNVTVPPNYNVLARRNGKVSWIGQCFSCGVGGDAISLVRELYKLEFVEAVKFVLSNKRS